jgi:dipeptidyl-peptidase 4
VADSFPRQSARTRGFTLGVPRSFQVSSDGQLVVFLRSKGGSDPVNCLWALDIASGQERLIADPAELLPAGREDDPVEKARRERARERAAGVVAFATDAGCTIASFTLAGSVFVAELRQGTGSDPGTAVRELTTRAPAADPRPDPAGRYVGYVADGALRLHDIATGEDRALADPAGAEGTSFGLAEFIAAEEMDRRRGYWWAPDGSAILVARVDETPVRVLHIFDPANPATPARSVRYPAAGTPNADVSLFIATVDGKLTAVDWDAASFPYLVNACWQGSGNGPVVCVATRDQREMRLLAIDPGTGASRLVRSDTDPAWLDIVRGVPARTADGKIVWTADVGGAKRVVTGTTEQHAADTADVLTPDSLNVREVLSVDGDTILFSASADDPGSISLWTAGPAGVVAASPAHGTHGGQLGGGSLLLTSRDLEASGASTRVLRSSHAGWTQMASIGSLAEAPNLPAPRPDLLWSAAGSARLAILLPSWHEPGSGKLPVLCDPYGGPHGQRVLAAKDAYLPSQWFAEQGFAVVVADGRGTPGRGPASDRLFAGDLAGPALDDQVEALHAAADRCADLDLSRVGIRGWSFGGFLSALAVLRRPDVFHAAVAGAPVTDWRLYDTCYTERYLGHPDTSQEAYEQSSLLADAPKLTRPLLLIHGLADDNVLVAHSLRLSSALLAAGRPHSVLPLSGITHMASRADVAENLLLLQVDFLRTALGVAPA